MTIPIEIIGIMLTALLTILIGLQSWVLLELVDLKVKIAGIEQKFMDLQNNRNSTDYESDQRR